MPGLSILERSSGLLKAIFIGLCCFFGKADKKGEGFCKIDILKGETVSVRLCLVLSFNSIGCLETSELAICSSLRKKRNKTR